MRFWKSVLSSVCLLGVLSGMASAEVLYDASLLTNPEQQGWAYNDNSFLIGVGPTITDPTAVNVYTTLDSTATRLIEAGYANTTPITIGAGTHLTFDLQLASESHVSTDRAGLSVIAIGDNLTGVELGFWTNQVWAQNVGFTHGEGASFTTTGSGTGVGGLNHFDLFFSNTGYTLFANGNTTPLLTGNLRDYSSFGIPYNIPDFLFVGDDTTSAQASSRISFFSVAPEPSALLLFLVPLGFVALLRRNQVIPQLTSALKP